jgi:hypothetical protein
MILILSKLFISLLPAIIRVNPGDSTVLGAPVGGSEVADKVLQREPDEQQRLSVCLKLLSAHDGFCLLNNCFSIPKLGKHYLLRHV